MNRAVLLVLLLTVIVAGCLGQAENVRPSTTSSSSTFTPPGTKYDVLEEGQEDPVVEGINAFAIDLYHKLAEEYGNVFFSPYSVETALAMTYEGVRGSTREEMGKVLHLPPENDTRWTGFRYLLLSLGTPGGSPYVLKTANALWVQRDYPINEKYLWVTRGFYMGEVEKVDFMNDPEGAAREINGWVENQTNGRIKDIVSRLSPATKLVITNAIYFRGNWSSRFKVSETKNGTFYSPSGPVTVPMMHQTGKFPYFENNELQALELPYEGGRLDMLIILPRRGRFDEVEASLSLGPIEGILNGTVEESVEVTLPKFRFEKEYHLKDTLMEMGMRNAFTLPDFSGISSGGGLVISDVIHKTFISVAENGTEAAAATAVIMTLAATVEPEDTKVFRADHPFIFLIYDRETGAILFMGRVVDPRE
ncbi:serpin family protein [Thermococcus sp. GR7]|uniref:serpin family protein n=1 Tax=unclassified Thermococcus TaxID=2627626 RepID=UPI00142FC0C5|nr:MULTISPECIES: serpin family protein [unclassified Thermococcus]NJE45982.1 serpin family protein [Thermococcus sp. GR7]NJE78475.1 serpin family protein [Thermococcus sp. GR4]NJF22178.1 serpin family protein [Thermococcus sp. GR5]